MRKWMILLALVTAISGLVWYLTRPRPVAVELVSVERGSVEETVSNTRTGTIKACRRSGLSLPIGGQVAVLNVDVGDRVAVNEVLLELWNEDRKAQVRQAQAALAAASRRADSACVGARNDQRELARAERLFARKLASQSQIEAARTRASASQAQCQSAGAEIEVAAAARDVQQTLLEKTRLRAPYAGIVAEVSGELGEYVTPSPPGVATPPAVDLIEADCLYVVAPVDEVDVGLLRLELPARITLDAFPGRALAGHIKRIAPYVEDRERQARTVDVDVVLDEPPEDLRLLIGYSADIEVILARRDGVLRVPTELVLDAKRVLLFDPGSERLVEREVTLGLRNWNYAEIVDGLAEGERIVSSLGQKGVTAGVPAYPAGSGQAR